MVVVEGAEFREPKLVKAATRVSRGRADAMVSWAYILKVLAASEVAGNSELAQRLGKFVRDTSVYKDAVRRQPDREPSFYSSEAGRDVGPRGVEAQPGSSN